MPDILVKTGTHNEQLYVTYSVTQNVASNTSTITCGMFFRVPSGWNVGPWSDYGGSYVGTSALTFNGGISNIGAGDHVLASGKQFTVQHNADGTGAATIAWKWGVNSSWGGFVYPSGSFTVDLPTIARASQPSCITWPDTTVNVGDIGSSIYIHMNRASTAFTHTVRYVWGSLSGTIATGVTDYTQWTIPMAFCAELPSSTVGTGLIYVDTYNGAALIGTKSVAFNANVPASVKPSCTAVVTIGSAISGKAVQTVSTLAVSITGTPNSGSSIASYAVTVDGKTYTRTTGSIATDPLLTSGTLTVKATVTDQRGRTSAEWTQNITVLAYAAPIASLTAKRYPNETSDGVQARLTSSISSLDGQNTAAYAFRYKKTSESNWTSVTPSDPGGAFVISNLDKASAYDVEATVTDMFSSTTARARVPIAFVLMDLYHTGKGITFGRVATGDDIHIAMPVWYESDIHLSSGANLQNLINLIEAEGSANGWYWRRWYNQWIEAWYSENGTSIDITQACGSIYRYANGDLLLPLPLDFGELIHINAKANGQTVPLWAGHEYPVAVDGKISQIGFTVFAPTAASNEPVNLRIYIAGYPYV